MACKGSKWAREKTTTKPGPAPRQKWNRGDPAIGERYYEDDESEFIVAMERFMDRTGNRFPTWSDALAVLKTLGYRKPADPAS